MTTSQFMQFFWHCARASCSFLPCTRKGPYKIAPCCLTTDTCDCRWQLAISIMPADCGVRALNIICICTRTLLVWYLLLGKSSSPPGRSPTPPYTPKPQQTPRPRQVPYYGILKDPLEFDPCRGSLKKKPLQEAPKGALKGSLTGTL